MWCKWVPGKLTGKIPHQWLVVSGRPYFPLKKIKYRMYLPGQDWPRPMRRLDLRNARAAQKLDPSCGSILRINAINSDFYVSLVNQIYNKKITTGV